MLKIFESETERIKDVQLKKRLTKAIEYKTSLKKFCIKEEDLPELKEFSVTLNDWVKDGIAKKGKIKIPALEKQLEYELITPKFTYIRLKDL